MTTNRNLPWIEKYRPETFNDISHHEEIIKSIENMIDNNNLMNMIFVGNMGSGKSSTSRVISRKLYGAQESLMTMKLNASDQRGINEIRDLVDNFASRSFNKNIVRMIILDEADAMTIDAQLVLSQLIDKYKTKIVFCVICNYIRKIHSNIKSRCILFRFKSLSVNSVFSRIKSISESEDISISDDLLYEMAKLSNGDMRQAINILYSVNFDKELTIEKLYQYIKKPSDKVSKNILKIFNSKKPISEKYSNVSDIIHKNGYSLFQLLQIILGYVIKTKKYNLLPILAEMEMNLSGDFSESIQLSYLVSLFAN
jgi:replication factor C subunit 3/5